MSRLGLGGGREDRLGKLGRLAQAREAAECRRPCRLAGTPSSRNRPGSRGPRTRSARPRSCGPAWCRPSRAARSTSSGRSICVKSVVIRWFGSSSSSNQKAADLRQHAALVGNAGGQHPVERADAVGADQQQLVAQVVDIADFAAADLQIGQRSLQQGRLAHGVFLRKGGGGSFG